MLRSCFGRGVGGGGSGWEHPGRVTTHCVCRGRIFFVLTPLGLRKVEASAACNQFCLGSILRTGGNNPNSADLSWRRLSLGSFCKNMSYSSNSGFLRGQLDV